MTGYLYDHPMFQQAEKYAWGRQDTGDKPHDSDLARQFAQAYAKRCGLHQRARVLAAEPVCGVRGVAPRRARHRWVPPSGTSSAPVADPGRRSERPGRRRVAMRTRGPGNRIRRTVRRVATALAHRGAARDPAVRHRDRGGPGTGADTANADAELAAIRALRTAIENDGGELGRYAGEYAAALVPLFRSLDQRMTDGDAPPHAWMLQASVERDGPS